MMLMSKLAVVAVAAFAVSLASGATTIDNFSTAHNLVQVGVGGPVSVLTASAGALGGDRLSTVQVTAGASNATSNVGAIPSVLSLSSNSGTDANFTEVYGSSADLNANFSTDNAFIVRLIQTDVGSVQPNSITVTTTGLGTATFQFAVPGTVGAPSGLATPFDVILPFAGFSGGPVNFANIDKITYDFNLPRNGDWQIQLFGTTSVPEPAALGFMAPAALLFMRRRQA